MEQPELDLRIISDPGIVHINGKCMLKKSDDKFAVHIAGCPFIPVNPATRLWKLMR